jgi:thioredoxin 1
MPEPVTDDTFADDVLRHDRPVLVEFWARWCPPCRMVDPVLAEIEQERGLTVRKIDADENPATARDYQVLSLPTMILFSGGRPVWTAVGAKPKARLLAELDGALSERSPARSTPAAS